MIHQLIGIHTLHGEYLQVHYGDVSLFGVGYWLLHCLILLVKVFKFFFWGGRSLRQDGVLLKGTFQGCQGGMKISQFEEQVDKQYCEENCSSNGRLPKGSLLKVCDEVYCEHFDLK